HIADDVDTNGSKPPQRYLYVLLLELSVEHVLHRRLCLGNGHSAHHNCASFRQFHLPLAINRSIYAVSPTTPEVQNQRVSGTKHIFRTSRHVKRQLVRVSGAHSEGITAKPA